MVRVDRVLVLCSAYCTGSDRDDAVRVGISVAPNYFLDIPFRVCYNGRKWKEVK